MIEYTEITNDRGEVCIHAKADNYEMIIPVDPTNADYQAYLDRDNPDYGKPTQL